MVEATQAIERREIARAISTVENRDEGCDALLARAYRRVRWPSVIGVTGPSGSGKSTLVDALSAEWAAAGARIAILAIDPSSPYSGGAVLGDRIRRKLSAGFDNVYFRSLSSRGHVGGLNETATDLVAVLALFDFDRVIVETVGAGQADVEIHETADCTVVVTVPGLGDAIQASKAGLMEIGDIFAVNKADLPGADEAALDIERMLATAYNWRAGAPVRRPTPGLRALERRHGGAGGGAAWMPPVLRVVATQNRGVAELAAKIDEFLEWSERTGRTARRVRERVQAQIMRALSSRLMEPFSRDGMPLETWIERVIEGNASPLEAAQALIDFNHKEAP